MLNYFSTMRLVSFCCVTTKTIEKELRHELTHTQQVKQYRQNRVKWPDFGVELSKLETVRQEAAVEGPE